MEVSEIKIPRDRIAVLIGKKGETKLELQKKLKTKLIISSETGDVTISGESIDVYISKQIITAIGRGFNPEIALKLLNDENSIEIININDYAKGSKEKLTRIRSRIIGTEGRARSLMEQMTNTYISVYGKTVSVIGRIENVFIARRAIESLLRGSKHGNVYAMLEREREKIS